MCLMRFDIWPNPSAHLPLGADVLEQRQVVGRELSDTLQVSLVDDGYQVQIMRLGERNSSLDGGGREIS